MGKTRIAILSAGDEPDLPGLDGIADQVEAVYARDEDTLARILPEAEILLVTDFRTGMLERVWPENHRLDWIHATSAGVDALMIDPIINSKITVTNARGIFDRGIAEYVLGAVLLFAKDTLGNLTYQKREQWCHRDTEMVHRKHAVIVGAGSIGSQTADLLRAIGMRVTGVARSAREDSHFDTVVASKDLPGVLADTDFVVITAPLTEQTRGLFDDQMLAHLPAHARLINVGRGPIVKTDSLVRALQAGKLAGAALDVFEEEPLPAGHPLWQMPNVMISAHMAGDFIGWRRALGEQFAENFRRWRNGNSLFNQVKKPPAR